MRDNIFNNLVKDEDSFTELLCNMFKYDYFRYVFFDYIGIDNREIFEYDTQYRTGNLQKNGRPDIVIFSEQDFIFIEIKVGDTPLTRNQPKGYIKELSYKKIEHKKLFFIIPRKYKFEQVLINRFIKYKINNISTEILYWEDFFEFLKKNSIFKINDFCAEYYNLIKNWYGYENNIFFNKENKKMDKLEIGKFVSRIDNLVNTIGDLLSKDGYKVKYSKNPGEFGFNLFDKNNIEICWFGAWIPIWSKTGEVIILTLSSNCENKIACVKKITIDDVEFQYFCFDSIVIQDNFIEKNFLDVLLRKISEIKAKSHIA